MLPGARRLGSSQETVNKALQGLPDCQAKMGHDGSRSESPSNGSRKYRPIDPARVTRDAKCGVAELQTVIAAAMMGCGP